MAVLPAHILLQARGTSDGLTNADAGAIAGSVVGGFVAILLLIFCCIRWSRYQSEMRRTYRRRYRSSHSSSSSSSSSSSDGDEPRVRGVPVRGPTAPPTTKPRPVRVSESVRVTERIPGGPRYPTYKAIPIPNPRNNPKVKHRA